MPRRAQPHAALATRAATGKRRQAGRGQRPPGLESRTAAVSGTGTSPAGHVADIQRSRLLAAAAGAIEEHGYAHSTVAQITAKARVSRRTFYELFDSREACFATLIEDVVGLIEQEVGRAGLERLVWREQVRGGLSAILAFFDREPVLARVCVVQALQGGPRVLALREQTITRLAAVLDGGREQSLRGAQSGELTGEGMVGAALGILYARLSRGEHEPLVGLLSELMGMIVLPYLGPAAARREQRRTVPAAGPVTPKSSASSAHGDPLLGVPMRLTYRTARVLDCIDSQPGVSNRGVADRAGISDQGQISKLLARLERLGLIANMGEGHLKGEPNAWQLTPLGALVAQRLGSSAGGLSKVWQVTARDEQTLRAERRGGKGLGGKEPGNGTSTSSKRKSIEEGLV
jgi:AcrR family transcriptional regulator